MSKEGAQNWSSRVCDTCRSETCIVYCLTDSAYMCSACDARVHAPNSVASFHERVWVCDLCELAPAAFLCKADAASLCSSCDADIHSANPQASRHHRVPILPITGSLLGEEEDHDLIDLRNVSSKWKCNRYEAEKEEKEKEVFNEAEDMAEAATWLFPNPVKNSDEIEQNNIFLHGGKVDEYLDCNACGDNQFSASQYYDQHNYSIVPQENEDYANISVVPPVHCGVHIQQQPQHFQQGLDFDSSQVGLSYHGSISQSVSISPMDVVGVVPESTIRDVSVSHSKPLTIGTSDLVPHIPMPFTSLEREARVLRYREKRKTRKFEKKIRYASRQAYAETRPRIKGRFVKETDAEEAGYGIVPSELILNIPINKW